MIRVLIPTSPEFSLYEEELKELYETCQDKITDTNNFSFIVSHTLLYLFLWGNALIGGIYYFLDEDKRLFLNGFAYPKKYPITVECVKLSTSWFTCDIYAEAQNRASALCLIKSGFKRVDGNLFVLKRR